MALLRQRDQDGDTIQAGWTEMDVIQIYPVTIYLGLGGGYLGTRPWFRPAMNPDHLLYQGNQTQIRQRRVECENRGGMGFGRKRPHDRHATVSFAVIISRIAALLPSDLSPSHTMGRAILLPSCDRETHQRRRIVTSISTRRTGDDNHLKYSLDRSHVKRIPRLDFRDNIIVSTMPPLGLL